MSRTIVLLALIACSTGSWAIGQNKADRKDERRENQRVSDCKQDVQKAQRELNLAIKAFRLKTIEAQRAADMLRSTQRTYSQAREAAEERLADKSGLPEAIRKMRSLRDEIAVLSKPILDKLHETQKWKVVNKKATDSAQIREKLLADETQTDDDLATRLTALDTLIAAPETMENEAIDADPKVKHLKLAYHQSLDEIAELRRKVDSSGIDADPEVKSSRNAVEAREREVDRQRSSIAPLNAKVASAQSNLAAANRKLQQAQAADQKDSNKAKQSKPGART